MNNVENLPTFFFNLICEIDITENYETRNN